MKTLDLTALSKIVAKNKYVLAVLALGLVLLLWPSGKSGDPSAEHYTGIGDDLASSGIPLDTEALRISQMLEEMEGVGRATVLLSHEGAVVVCQGANSAKVRLEVTNALASYTGLRSDKISVMKMK